MISKLHLQGVQKLDQINQSSDGKAEVSHCGSVAQATQRLVNFLAPSGNKLGAIFSPMKMESNTYGKRKKVEISKREPLSYLPI
ncbi:hypothetical protein FD755_002776 [Muntiacus reevesi]|uniref:Islet amyloid polypeptide n=1 Tax=Muntiacus reevesi TaxID=9886 RepID=A0A5J5NAZ9_MUNRE|nr:hypothetical protein FD755_002776 [Muntiacus reevesi]